jgi:DNA recombination protein RmuC
MGIIEPVILTLILVLSIVSLVLSIRTNKRAFGNDHDEKLLQIEEILKKLTTDSAWMVSTVNKLEPALREEFRNSRLESGTAFKDNREELNKSLHAMSDNLTNSLKSIRETIENKLLVIQQENNQKVDHMRKTVDEKLRDMQDLVNKRLEEMQKVVDEKLQETVEKRFNESFKLISERLEQVHKGLGEMQSLASGVGDLKKVLTNVKTRGNVGEIQLGVILEQFLSREQYEQNAVTRSGSMERVEFAIKLPGRNTQDKSVLLPVDSKFPNEDYQRLIEAYDNMSGMSTKELEIVQKQFENSVKKCAGDIKNKYINPPMTTDFAIMFVPTEGLYAEILRRTGLFETLQRDYRITVVGPTNLVAFLSSLQMGFRTLAIEKRSSEVWEILGAVKTQFGAFGGILDKTKKKLQEATNVIDEAAVKSRAIERKLRNVQDLPESKSNELIGEAISVEDEAVEKEPDKVKMEI